MKAHQIMLGEMRMQGGGHLVGWWVASLLLERDGG